MVRLIAIPLIVGLVITGVAMVASWKLATQGYWRSAGALAGVLSIIILADRFVRTNWEGSLVLTLLTAVVPLYVGFGVVWHFRDRPTSPLLVGAGAVVASGVVFFGLMMFTYVWS